MSTILAIYPGRFLGLTDAFPHFIRTVAL